MKKHVVGFRHVGIITKDIDKSLVFYRDILGLEVIQEFEDSSDYINEITNLKNATAELLEYPTHRTDPYNVSIINVGLPHIALRVEDADFTYEHLLSKNITVLSKPILSSEGIAKVFFCLDPDNVRVEIVEMLNN